MTDVENHPSGSVAVGPIDSLRDATFRGVRWVALARVAAECFAFVSAVALAHLVPPSEFGRAAVPLAIVPLAVILTFEGCASALVQRKEVDEADFASAVLMSLFTGLLMSALTFILAKTLGVHFFGARIAGLIEVVSPVFLLASIGAVPRARLWRRLDFPRVSIIEVVSLAIGAAVSISLGLAGLDAGAIIGGALAGTAASSVLLYALAPYTLRWGSRRSVHRIAGFGVPAALAGLVGVAFANVAYVILAARATAVQTGLYWRSFQLGTAYQEKVSGIMLRLSFPVYSRTADPAELRRLHERATRLHATAVVPLLAILIVVAPLLVPWLFGEPWRGAIVPTQILAVAGMIAAVLTGYPQVMLALGRPRALLKFNLVVLVLYVAVVAATVDRGLTALCIGVVGVYVGILFGVYRFLLFRHIGAPMSRLVTDLAPALAGSAGILAAGIPLRHVLVSAGLPVPATLVAVGLASSLIYLAVVRALFAAAWSDLVLLASNLAPPAWRNRGRGAPESTPALTSTPS
jgi:O-antigen/teichoic acid export membrane protein